MSVSKPRISFLATSVAVGYSAAHDEGPQNSGRWGAGGVLGRRLCVDHQAGLSQARVGRRSVYVVGAGGEDGLRGGIVQRLGQGHDADEARGQDGYVER